MRLDRMVALAMLALAACATTPSPDLPTELVGRTDDRGVQHVDVVAGSYWFRPNHIVVKVKAPVSLSLRAQTGVVPHSFVLQAPQAGIDIRVPLTTEPRVVRFTPTRPGSYPFYCDKRGVFGNHRDKGMHGVLEIVE